MSQATPTRVKYFRSARTVTGWTIVMLVLLRVAVGWHFFYEGVWKLKSGGGFSSTPYLMAATGPLDHVFHWMVDDMDGTKKRMTQNYLYDQLDLKCETILRHYGATDKQGYQDKDAVEKLQKKVNGGLTDLQIDGLRKDIDAQREVKKTLSAKDSKSLTPDEAEALAKATRRIEELEKADTARKDGQLTAAEQEVLFRESKKLTEEQVKSLKDFVERKKHGVKDDATVAKLFENGEFFVKQVRYGGEYVDPAAPDKTNQVTTVTYAALADKQDKIVAAIKGILDDLDKMVKEGVSDPVLAEDQTSSDRLAQMEKLKAPLPEATIVPKDAADSTWITPAYVESLVTKRYELLKKTYDLTERQDKSRFGSRYCDQKLHGHYDRNSVDAVLADADFKNDLKNYKELLDQISEQEKRLDIKFNDQRYVFDNGKKRDGLRNKLLARVEAPGGDVDLPKIQGLAEYIGPIKEMTQAQFSLGPVPVNPREFEFPGKLLKQIGWDVPKKTLTYWQDLGMMLGLTVIGACLILGLFTRLAALGGAVMLAMFYLAMPPFLGAHVPENAAEGHYLYVNKNLIEMLVMLAFATSGIGRWFGLDAFIHAMFGRRHAETEEAPVIATAAQPSSGPGTFSTTRAFPPERSGTRP